MPRSERVLPPLILRRAGLVTRVVVMLAAAGLLAACDKCGDSIFRMDAGPIACKNEVPR